MGYNYSYQGLTSEVHKNQSMISSPAVAIVILNWNGRKFLEQFLPTVLKSSYVNFRVIVADNASTDDSVEWLQNHHPGISIIKNERNEGFAQGYNTALKQVDAPYYVLLNSDVEVTEHWIEPIIELMESNPTIACCQPKLLDFKNKSAFEYAGACGGWMDIFGYPFARGRVFETCETDQGQYDNPTPCFWASGAAMFIRSNTFHEAGGFDETFFAHQEEIDLCWRLQRSGYAIYVHPKSVVYHVGGGTLPKGNSLKTYLNFRNNLIMMKKNLPWSKSLLLIPVRFLLDWMAAAKYLFAGDSGYFKAILKAQKHFITYLFTQKRGIKHPKIATTKLEGYYAGSIVWHYFIMKRKRFSEIVSFK